MYSVKWQLGHMTLQHENVQMVTLMHLIWALWAWVMWINYSQDHIQIDMKSDIHNIIELAYWVFAPPPVNEQR